MWLTELRLVLPDSVLENASLCIEDGCIARLVEGPAPGEAGLSCAGLTGIPGIIDLHGDMLERELEPRPGALFPVEIALHELDKRLAGAGVTTAFAAIGFWDSERRKKIRTERGALMLVEALLAHRDQLLVDFRIHARYEIATPSVAPVLQELICEGKVDLVSLMDHTPGQGQYRDLERYYTFMAEWLNRAREDVIAETQRRIQQAADTEMIWREARQIAGMATERGLPLASHDDDTVEKVGLVARLGVSISEFPVSIEAARMARQLGMHTVMGAPNALRGTSTSGNLTAMEGIQAGCVDVLAADYHPGAMLHACFRLAASGVLSLHEAVRMITLNPALAAGLHDRGSLEAGKHADIVLVDTGRLPRVRAVFRHGLPIYWDRYMAQLSGGLSGGTHPAWNSMPACELDRQATIAEV